MAKDLKEQIEIMTHYLNGGEVEIYVVTEGWVDHDKPSWDWTCSDYRIKEEKETITIEKWLVKVGYAYYTIETSDINALWKDEKVKLLDTYKVEL